MRCLFWIARHNFCRIFITDRTFIVTRSWNKSVHFQTQQRCYCEHPGCSARAIVMRRHYSITYTQSLHAINGLLAVGRVGNLLCGRPSYSGKFTCICIGYIYFFLIVGLYLYCQFIFSSDIGVKEVLQSSKLYLILHHSHSLKMCFRKKSLSLSLSLCVCVCVCVCVCLSVCLSVADRRAKTNWPISFKFDI